MIYVECNPDEVLVRIVAGFPPRQIVHNFNGKYGVMREVSQQYNARAMIDEDPASNQPAYLRRMTVAQDMDTLGLRLWTHSARNNQVVMLRPRLEEWIVRTAVDARLNMADYGLPSTAKDLKDVINTKLPEFEQLLGDLRRSPRLVSLRNLLRR